MAGFEDQYRDLFACAYGVAYRFLLDRDEARDVAQEAVVRAYARWRKVESHASPWVSRTAGNLAIDVLRRRQRRRTPVEIRAASNGLGEAAEVADAIRRLPRRQREAIFLRYYADLSEAEMAEVLGCSTGTIKTHLSRGTTALARFMKEGGDEPAQS